MREGTKATTPLQGLIKFMLDYGCAAPILMIFRPVGAKSQKDLTHIALKRLHMKTKGATLREQFYIINKSCRDEISLFMKQVTRHRQATGGVSDFVKTVARLYRVTETFPLRAIDELVLPYYRMICRLFRCVQ